MASFEDASQLPVRWGDEGAPTHQARAQYTNQTKRVAERYNTEHHVHSVLPDQLRPLSETNVTRNLNGAAADSEISKGLGGRVFTLSKCLGDFYFIAEGIHPALVSSLTFTLVLL